jgi:hypothetical protein
MLYVDESIQRTTDGRGMDCVLCVILLDDMTFLQSLDLFPDDEYNGPQWVWFNC